MNSDQSNEQWLPAWRWSDKKPWKPEESLALESFEIIFSAENMGNLFFRRHEEPHQRWKIVMGFDQKVNIASILAIM